MVAGRWSSQGKRRAHGRGGGGLGVAVGGPRSAARRAARARRHMDRVCALTGARGSPRRPLRRCGRCRLTFYGDAAAQRAHWPLHGPTCAFVDAAARSAVAAASADAAAAALARDVAGGGSPTTSLTLARLRALADAGALPPPAAARAAAAAEALGAAGDGAVARFWAAPGVAALLLGGDDLLTRHARRRRRAFGLRGLPTPDYAAEVLAGADAAAYGALRAAELGDGHAPAAAACFAALFVPLLVAAACRRAPGPGPGRGGAGAPRALAASDAARDRCLALWADADVREACGDALAAAAALARAAAAREAPRPAAEPRRRGLAAGGRAADKCAAVVAALAEVAGGANPGDAAALVDLVAARCAACAAARALAPAAGVLVVDSSSALARGGGAGDYFAACATADRAAVAVAAVEHALDFCRDALGDGAAPRGPRAAPRAVAALFAAASGPGGEAPRAWRAAVAAAAGLVGPPGRDDDARAFLAWCGRAAAAPARAALAGLWRARRLPPAALGDVAAYAGDGAAVAGDLFGHLRAWEAAAWPRDAPACPMARAKLACLLDAVGDDRAAAWRDELAARDDSDDEPP